MVKPFYKTLPNEQKYEMNCYKLSNFFMYFIILHFTFNNQLQKL